MGIKILSAIFLSLSSLAFAQGQGSSAAPITHGSYGMNAAQRGMAGNAGAAGVGGQGQMGQGQFGQGQNGLQQNQMGGAVGMMGGGGMGGGAGVEYKPRSEDAPVMKPVDFSKTSEQLTKVSENLNKSLEKSAGSFSTMLKDIASGIQDVKAEALKPLTEYITFYDKMGEENSKKRAAETSAQIAGIEQNAKTQESTIYLKNVGNGLDNQHGADAAKAGGAAKKLFDVGNSVASTADAAQSPARGFKGAYRAPANTNVLLQPK